MKLFKLFFLASLFPLFSFFLVNPCYAAEDISISEIEYLDNSVFKVNVNTNGDLIDGVTLILDIDGDISISEIAEGMTGLCDSFDYQQTEKSFSITCLEEDSKAINGTIAEITATTGDSYSMQVSTDSSDFGDLEVNSITNINVNSTQEENDITKSSSTTLLYVSAGIFLLLLFVLLFLLLKKRDIAKKN